MLHPSQEFGSVPNTEDCFSLLQPQESRSHHGLGDLWQPKDASEQIQRGQNCSNKKGASRRHEPQGSQHTSVSIRPNEVLSEAEVSHVWWQKLRS